MVRLMAAKLMLVIFLFGSTLQGIADIARLGCQPQSGSASMAAADSDTASDDMGATERCNTFKLGVHGAAGCEVCPSCTLCHVAICLDTQAVAGALAVADAVPVPIAGARSITFPPIKHPPRIVSLVG